ncbi:MAG TPA: DNA polymerase Y family protein [Steroidobacteraceae bacterium]|nr:DNA polymerase Y family protein [Steroidobacteraceae bacterium]
MRGASGSAKGQRPHRDATGDLFGPPVVAAAVRAAKPRSAPAAPDLAAVPLARPAPRQLWLALAFTTLPLVAATRLRGSIVTDPLVVVTGEGARRAVSAVNAAAARAGIRPGLGLNAAHALAPRLTVAEREPFEEARELRRLARWATSLTPWVSLEAPDQLLLEVQGSLRLFGGAPALLGRVGTELEAQGHTVALALAPTSRAAIWLARAAPGTSIASPATLAGHLARLPLWATAWPAQILEDCARLGLDTLGELKRLPRDGLARRFEPFVLAELDEAFGFKPAPRRRYLVPERFHERAELPVELADVAQLTPYCERLLERMGHFLRARTAGITRLAFLFAHRDQKPSCVVLGRTAPAACVADWQGLLRERLMRVTLPAPVLRLTLRTGTAVPLPGTSATLPGFGSGEAIAEAAALLDRLRARLGEAAVSGVCLVPEHRPEAAWRAVRPELAPPGHTGTAALPRAPRPLWLLLVPEPLVVRDGQPCRGGRLLLESGPERIESGWWDGRGVARDYYVAITRGGARLWIFRERGARRWFLHGVFG